MAHEVTIGGERLGSGKKMKAYLSNYERSTHDLSFVFRSTMAAGTLVPFMSEVALPGDTFDIHLNLDALTHPTIGPLFGSYKVEADIFQAPIRLYNGKLHMNMLGIGLDMAKTLLPQIKMTAEAINIEKTIDNQHINPSCIFSYLGMRGLGIPSTPGQVSREFNAVPWLAYWDIYKNYYANKQEEIGVVIHKDPNAPAFVMTAADFLDSDPEITLTLNPSFPFTYQVSNLDENSRLVITGTGLTSNVDPSQFKFQVKAPNNFEFQLPATQAFQDWEIIPETGVILATNPTDMAKGSTFGWAGITYTPALNPSLDTEPKMVTFPLTNIDEMRKYLLRWLDDTPFTIETDDFHGETPIEPYSLAIKGASQPDLSVVWSKNFSQEGLGIKTYNSDLFNNWIRTEWIDGPDGISAVTAIDTSGGSFTIDELNLSKKIYDMLNRIAISGGTYDDWLDAVYTHERQRSAENPMYLGGLIQHLVFQEVVSNAAANDQPLGTLAGRGKLSDHRTGGNVVARIDEPSYLIGIVSLTPHIDYSQGNKWDTNLKTLNDLHKPALDEIGFQDLVTDQMAWWDTTINSTTGAVTFKSAGKQPAWINYMTNINVVRGNFADQTQQMFMVLNRRYGVKYPTPTTAQILDVTTYIDPTKFNHIFADTRIDAQNFWVQIGVNIEARRKMSAKIIPNL